ncbi:MAG: type II toxin-antitoxin system VapC family toxin [Chloroflexi bacterium]|nr:MAG: type II toxin-antitoxin system VapC family toxin [Chloroflexota bacterium]
MDSGRQAALAEDRHAALRERARCRRGARRTGGLAPAQGLAAAHADGRADAKPCSGRPSGARGSLTLVIDASVAFAECLADGGFTAFGREELIAPPLFWAETRSALHEATWRGEISRELGNLSVVRLDAAPVAMRAPRGLGLAAWRIADELGWAKTYDAEYVALARVAGCRLVTRDAALRRATERLGFVIGPTEI